MIVAYRASYACAAESTIHEASKWDVAQRPQVWDSHQSCNNVQVHVVSVRLVLETDIHGAAECHQYPWCCRVPSVSMPDSLVIATE